ncbi:hypothetical protein LTR10_023686 [Elasticomyces elasticus]|nr:hypothetical protein LTR10_023686 [Elasticomyces elasticus]KAK5041893.1 hypothetical protein LTR13_001698 [Exophiala sideris]KAK5185161.1 hypothetical protein LTR44_002149 [Eurotiomycetes sp. CCFEE 6388]
MGRWGLRKPPPLPSCIETDWDEGLFEGDSDVDIMDRIHVEIQEMLKSKAIIVPDVQLADLLFNKEQPTCQPTQSSMTSLQVRDHLNSISDRLFLQCRKKGDLWYGKYKTIILGVLLMSGGVKLGSHRTFLYQAAGRVGSSPGYRPPMNDIGFRDPGKVQFLAALDHYEDGKPRDIQAPSCFKCGRISTDIRPATLKNCGRCKKAWYCDQECQKGN